MKQKKAIQLICNNGLLQGTPRTLWEPQFYQQSSMSIEPATYLYWDQYIDY